MSSKTFSRSQLINSGVILIIARHPSSRVNSSINRLLTKSDPYTENRWPCKWSYIRYIACLDIILLVGRGTMK